jgi:hypothetical protein
MVALVNFGLIDIDEKNAGLAVEIMSFTQRDEGIVLAFGGSGAGCDGGEC